MTVNNDLTLVAGGRSIAGWQRIRVTRGIERFPADFEIEMTEAFSDGRTVTATPGDPCQVLIGADTIITGYVDAFVPSIGRRRHSIIITGRSKCADVVDCSAVWPTMQISSQDVVGIASKLVETYGITASGTQGTGLQLPVIRIAPGQSVYELLEQICRWRALLIYDDTDGNLVLGPVGTDQAASGFVEGVNVEEATVQWSVAQRFQTYTGATFSAFFWNDSGDTSLLQKTVKDPFISRPRNKIIIVEGTVPGIDIQQARTAWEASRRMGRGMQLSLRTDTWRDSSGRLWTPNTLVPLSLPSLKIENKMWLISEVTYELGEDGTHAHLVIMPPEAFTVEPPLAFPMQDAVPAPSIGGG